MIRVSRHTTTGRILCSQGGALPDEATMKANALSAFPDVPGEEIEVVDLTDEEFAAALAAQNAPTLEQARAAKLAAIQAEKNRARDGGVVVDGVRYDTDAGAILMYVSFLAQIDADPAYSTAWKASTGADGLGVWVDMDAALFALVRPAVDAHISACFAWQAAREAEVAAAQTIAEVEAVSAEYGG
ncbi:DUF4376 domain-containing protein [Desulfovibrio aminophilus]|uniref:DUF4376 domain-containing protein n=1 Tax=Desulfovibrio aminophilus TaxID=81425 RepID=UPI000400FFF3|nr:DUF4376 domain-containing protein [Desulfovibrio aminophilus]